MKQTAVDWLVEQMINQGYFDKNKPLTFTNLDRLQHQAKEMEKQQIIEAFHKQTQKFYCNEEAEDYYNETYENK